MILSCVILVAASSLMNLTRGSFENQVSLNQGTTITMPTEYITNCYSTMEGVTTVTYICIMQSHDNSVTFATLFTEISPTQQNSSMASASIFVIIVVIVLAVCFFFLRRRSHTSLIRSPEEVKPQVKEKLRASGIKNQTYCGHCGSKLAPRSIYCSKCGSATGE